MHKFPVFYVVHRNFCSRAFSVLVSSSTSALFERHYLIVIKLYFWCQSAPRREVFIADVRKIFYVRQNVQYCSLAEKIGKRQTMSLLELFMESIYVNVTFKSSE